MTENQPLEVGTQVAFDIAQGHAVGTAIITAAEYDDGWLYRLDVLEGDRAEAHRDEHGELWVCEFEVRGLHAETADGCEFCRQDFNRPNGPFTCPYCHKAWPAPEDQTT